MNNNFFKTFKEAVRASLKKKRENQQDLADKMGMNKGNLSTVLSNEESLTAKMHGRIEKALGYKLERQSDGWAVHKFQESNSDSLERLVNEVKQRTSDDNDISEFQDDPLKALEIAEKLIRKYRMLMLEKD